VTEALTVTSGNEAPINTTDASVGAAFENKRVVELPLNARNIVGLLSLQAGVTRQGEVTGGRRDQANITIDGIDANEQQTGLDVVAPTGNGAFTPGVSVVMGSKSMDNSSTLESQRVLSTVIRNAINPDLEYSVSDFDVRHNINANWLLALPFGKGRKFFGDAHSVVGGLIGGWQLTGIALQHGLAGRGADRHPVGDQLAIAERRRAPPRRQVESERQR
jgi:hypothetical protein